MCASVSSLFDTWWHTWSLRLLFGQGARTRCSRGSDLRALSFSRWESSALVCLSFRGRRGSRLLPTVQDPLLPRHGGNDLVGLAGGAGRWDREGLSLSRSSPQTRVSGWMMMMRFRWHHLIQRLVLCWVMPRKSRRCLRVMKLRLSPINPPALRMTIYWRLWNAPRRGLTCRGSGPRWWRRRGVLMSVIFLAISAQLEWASYFFQISMRRLRGNGKSHFPLASTGFSIIVMLTWRGCVKTAMRGCPLWKRRWPAISPWARHPLLKGT